MLKKLEFKKIIVFYIIFLSIILVKKPSYGATGFKFFDNSPRMSVSCNNKKYDDVVIKFRDFSSLDETKIVFYTVENGKIGQRITDSNFIKKVDKHYGVKDTSILVDCNFTISNEYLKQKTNYFYVTATDKYNSPCKLEAFFRIKSKNGRYTADTAPRVMDWKASKGNCSFTVQDWVGVNYVRLYDMNSSNPSKVVLEKNKLPKGNSNIPVQLKNFIQKNGRYQIKIITEDSNKKYKQTATRVVNFSVLPEDAISNDKISINKTSLSLKIGETYKLTASATSNTNKTVTWSTSNSKIAKVSSDGTVTAVAKGTATITAKLISGKKATCSITVNEKSTSTAKSTKAKQKLTESLRYAYRFSTQAGGHITYIDSSHGDTRNRGRLEKGYSDCSWFVYRVYEHTGMMKKFVHSLDWGYHGCPGTKDVVTFNKGEKWDYSMASPRRCYLGALWWWKK